MKPVRSLLAGKPALFMLGGFVATFLFLTTAWASSRTDASTTAISGRCPRTSRQEPTTGAPSDAIVLFNGKDFNAWNKAGKWKVDEDGGTTAVRPD